MTEKQTQIVDYDLQDRENIEYVADVINKWKKELKPEVDIALALIKTNGNLRVGLKKLSTQRCKMSFEVNKLLNELKKNHLGTISEIKKVQKQFGDFQRKQEDFQRKQEDFQRKQQLASQKQEEAFQKQQLLFQRKQEDFQRKQEDFQEQQLLFQKDILKSLPSPVEEMAAKIQSVKEEKLPTNAPTYLNEFNSFVDLNLKECKRGDGVKVSVINSLFGTYLSTVRNDFVQKSYRISYLAKYYGWTQIKIKGIKHYAGVCIRKGISIDKLFFPKAETQEP